MLNADNTVAGYRRIPRTAGLMFTPATRLRPRLVIGKDDGQLTCAIGRIERSLWLLNHDVTTGMNVFDGIGDLIYGSYIRQCAGGLD